MNDQTRPNGQAGPSMQAQPVKINRKLNLVLQVDSAKGRLHVHSVPISRAMFEQHFLVIARALTQIYNNGLGLLFGPRVAKLMLIREAEAMGDNEIDRVNMGLLPEIDRLTNVLVPNERGWENLPYETAKKRGIIDEETQVEIENAIIYFTCASSIHLQSEVPTAVAGLRQFLGADTTLLNVTEYRNSLPTSTPVVITGESVTSTIVEGQSSIPT